MRRGDKAMTSKDIRKDSKAWLKTLIIGGAVTLLTSAYVFTGTFKSTPYDWNEAGRAGQFLVLYGIPVLVVSAILWAARFKKIPSLAFIVTTLVGGFFFIFSGAEFVIGLFESPEDFSIGGLKEILVFSLPMFIVAWFLWAKPKVGAVLLMILGIGMGVFMYLIHWKAPTTFDDWVIMAVFTIVPFVLGLFTLIRETIKPSRSLLNNTQV